MLRIVTFKKFSLQPRTSALHTRTKPGKPSPKVKGNIRNETNLRNRILIVGMIDSVHLARWLGQFADDGHEFLIFPSSPHRRVHPLLRGLLANRTDSNYRVIGAFKRLGVPLFVLDRLSGNRLSPLLLGRAIDRFQPDYLHALEIQHAGYMCLRTISRKGKGKYKFIVTNYGSDLFWFARFAEHKRRIVEILGIADGYAAECERDISLAKELGYEGRTFPVTPNAGGFSNEIFERPLTEPSNRKTILIKGYHGWVGRAKIALEAILLMADELEGLEVIVYSANLVTRVKAMQVRIGRGIQMRVFGKNRLSHSQMLELFSTSKVYVGLSLSDGISTSMLEAMVMGAIPVQTSTACCDEWFDDSGVKIDDLRAEAVAHGIRKALRLSESPKNAQTNKRIVRQKASIESVSFATRGFYSGGP